MNGKKIQSWDLPDLDEEEENKSVENGGDSKSDSGGDESKVDVAL
jgi:hypothetical protein